MVIDNYLAPGKVSKISGCGLTDEFIREACYRQNHPLPHIEVGRNKYPRIRVSAFEQWLREEEQR